MVGLSINVQEAISKAKEESMGVEPEEKKKPREPRYSWEEMKDKERYKEIPLPEREI